MRKNQEYHTMKMKIISHIAFFLFLTFPCKAQEKPCVAPVGEKSWQEMLEKTGLQNVDIKDMRHCQPKRIAERLVSANRLLQETTGLQGGVLGLWGRASLELHDEPRDDTVQKRGHMETKNDSFAMRAQFGSLAHEWLHGLDALTHQRIFGKQGMASSREGNAWHTGYKNLHKAEEWHSYMRGASIIATLKGGNKKEIEEYLERPWEQLSFAWEHLLYDERKEGWDNLVDGNSGSFARPTKEEVQKIFKPSFKELWQNMRKNLTDGAGSENTSPH